jgi:putative transposase
VDVGGDFEVHRAAVESVSVLFELYDGDAASYAQSGSTGAKLPTGWTVTAAKFEVQRPADEERARLVRSHFGARRKAFNWGLDRVKADLDAKSADPDHESVGSRIATQSVEPGQGRSGAVVGGQLQRGLQRGAGRSCRH